MNPELVPFQAEHLLTFRGRDGELLETATSALEKEQRGPAWTALLNDQPLGCSGILLMWPGVAQAWAMFTDDLLKKWPIWTTRTVRDQLLGYVVAHNLHRVELSVLQESEANRAWTRVLGFSPEGGVARQYTSDRRNMLRYEWIRDSVTTRRLLLGDRLPFLHLVADSGDKWKEKPFLWFINDCITIVAIQKEQIVGYAIYEHSIAADMPIALGRNLVVARLNRGQGIAETLHAARLRDCKARGLMYFVGFAHETSPAMERIFEKFGGTRAMELPEGIAYVQEIP